MTPKTRVRAAGRANSAGMFVGRVGGLAIALGVGALGGAAAAWADPGTSDRDPGPTAGRSSGEVSTHSPRRAATRSPARAVGRANGSDPLPGGTAVRVSAARAAATVRPAAPTIPSAPKPAAEAIADTAIEPAAAPAVLPALAESAPDPAAGSFPAVPAASPLSWTLTAAARRSPLAASVTADPTAAATASSIFGDSITVNPTVVWNEGVLSATLNASTTSGDPLSYVVISRPSLGGKIGGGPLLPLSNFGPGGSFTYVPYASTLTDATQTETFRIMVLENAPIVQFVENLLGPLGGLLIPQVLSVIHRIPIVGELLSPIIGQAEIVTLTENPFDLAAGRPTAFTYKMPSFDGTLISVNYFPAINVANGDVDSAPTILAASGLACAANTDPNTVYGQLFPSQQFGSLTPGIKPLREDAFTSPLLGGPSYDGGGGYNVITWDPRGEFASGGQLQIDNPFFEGRDTSEIISWLTSSANPANAQVKTAPDGDPLVGMTGGSYGGGIQLTTVDPRIDAITPQIGWNSLLSSLYPNGNQFKTGFGTILGAALFFTGARVNPAIYQGILTGVLFGWLSESSQAVLASVGPTTLLNQEKAPTLMYQGIDDTLFPLSQSVANGITITSNPWDPPFKLVWFCGGHGTCDIPNPPAEQDARGLIDNLKWLDQYVAGTSNAADSIPTFQWYDQDGLYWTADKLPWDPGFNADEPYTAQGQGGVLGLGPIIGGSGPAPVGDLPFSITNAGKAWNALNVSVTPPQGSQIVGSPTISFTYRGLGTSRTVYAQLVDDATGLVPGNNVTPIPVILDGRERTVTMSIEDIAYTVAEGDSLTLQITSSAVNYENFTTLGVIDISNITLDVPLRAIP